MRTILDAACPLDEILRLRDCATESELQTALGQLTRRLGFDSFLYGGRFPLGPQQHLDRIVTSYDAAWRLRYQTLGFAELDPTVRHAVSSILPLVWHDDMYVGADQAHFREEAQAHGIVSGATFPTHSREGETSLVSLALKDGSAQARELITDTLQWGVMISTFAHDAMRRLSRCHVQDQTPSLTARELEALRWVASGKTTWEISKILNISEHGVVHHMRSVMKKFDVASRHQAAARALALGLL